MLAPHAFGRTDRAAIAKPHLRKPTVSASWMLPTFAWTPVRHVDHYEFQLAADARFNAPVLGGDGSFTTRNTRATVRKAPPNGRYWWRVRSVTKNGRVSGWATGSVRKNWHTAPQLVSPANGGAFNYPTDPLILSWTPVAGAARYSVAIAADPTFTTMVDGAPMETAATSVNPPSSLPLGTYYWRVTPLDPEKNQGAPSAVRSFSWKWPTGTTATVRDLTDAYPQLDDPQLSWDPVPGAARYELDINVSLDFAPGSRICCGDTTVATKYSPTRLLPNNTYYWRVRAIDVHGNQGVWAVGPSFTQTFDNVGFGTPVLQSPSIKNLHLADNAGDPGTDLDPGSPGYQTKVPILKWDPVWGASAYDLYIVAESPSGCDWAHTIYHATTPIPVWTPLGASPGTPPYPTGGVGVEAGDSNLSPGTHYCVRIRALTDNDRNGNRVYGDFTYLEDAFAFAGYDSAGFTTPSMSAADYYTPSASGAQGWTPLFTWRAIPGATSYWVIVSRDPSFTTLVDYAFTRVPAYAPRQKTYEDETTHYYYAVLPSCATDGATCVAVDPRLTAYTQFDKRSTPPSLLAPANGAVVGVHQPTFQWTPVQGARKYRLQVSADPTFGTSLLDDVETDSTAYTSNTTYPPDATLYWRVRASDENGIGLTWSVTGTFTHSLPAPVLFDSNARIGEEIPVWLWNAVPGAVEYDLHAVLPDSSTRDVNGLPSPAFVAGLIAGNGFFRWSVRGEFPKAGGTTPGPYSASQVFTKILTPPVRLRAIRGRKSLVFTWASKAAARQYRFQIARHPDFSNMVDSVDTESHVYAPLLTQDDYWKGGRFYWRVAGIDDYGNVGKFTKNVVLRLPRRLR
jgi:hypothetical protein